MLKKLSESLTLKVLFIYIVVCIFSIAVFFGMYYYIIKNTVNESINNELRFEMKDFADNTGRRMSEINSFAEQLVFDGKIDYYLNKRMSDYEAAAFINNYLQPKVSTILTMANNISIRIYVNNETIPEVYYTSGNVLGRFEIMNISRVANKKEYNDFANKKDLYLWSQVEEDAKYGNISLLMKINDSTAKQAGIVRVIMKIDEVFDTARFNKKNIFVQISNDVTVFYDNFGEQDRSEKELFKVSSDLKIGGINIVLAVLKKSAFNIFTKSYVGVITVVLIVLGSILAAGFVIHQRLYKSYSVVMYGIKQFQIGNLDYNIPYTHNDEFGKISTQLNKFSNSLSQLIDDVTTAAVQNQEIEYNMLQTKINPHFLYNILSVFGRLAKCGKTKQLETMIKKLPHFIEWRCRITVNWITHYKMK